MNDRKQLYTFLSFDDGIRQKICSRMLYGIAWGTRGWVYIISHDVGYDIPSLSARYYVAFLRSASSLSAELQVAMADEESESREGAAMTQDQFSLLMGAFSASQTRMEERFAEFRAEIRLGPQRRHSSGRGMRNHTSTSARATRSRRRSMPKWTRP